jgi:hypothetical protein
MNTTRNSNLWAYPAVLFAAALLATLISATFGAFPDSSSIIPAQAGAIGMIGSR